MILVTGGTGRVGGAVLSELSERGLPPRAAHAAMATDPEPVTGTVARLTGTPAGTFADWAADHAADFRTAR
jgi:nucleoside-diphosphate-sugar epimerase